MRTLVFGGVGMVGREVVRAARRRGWPALGLSRSQADLRDPAALLAAAEAFAPQLVVNAAAFTQVDRCESESQHAFAVNGEGVAAVREAAARVGARMVHISTDYVFAGDASQPYREEDEPAPRSVYGASKLAGEHAALADPRALVVRTSWVFGAGGPNFVATIRRLVRERRTPLRVVDDQRGCPTYAPFLADALLELADRGAQGILHYANRGPVSWFELARTIVDLDGESVAVVPITTAEMPRPAPRPAYSVLAVERAEAVLGRRVEPWITGLTDYLRASTRRS